MFSCFGFAAWGISMSALSMDKEINVWVRITLFAGGFIFFLYTTLAHLPEIKEFIRKHETKPPMFDFENKKNTSNEQSKTTAGETKNV